MFVYCLNIETYEDIYCMDPILSRFTLIFCMNIVLLFEGFGNKLLRKIFVSKVDETNAGRRIVQNKKLHKFCVSPNIVRIIK